MATEFSFSCFFILEVQPYPALLLILYITHRNTCEYNMEGQQVLTFVEGDVNYAVNLLWR
jgi:hypothetical protein